MSFENFLQFWSVHNRQIIEFVFVSTFIIILFVIYRQFFAKTESTAGAGSHGTPVSIDTSEIEEKLKKILENQGAFKAVAQEATATTTTAPVSTEGAPAAAVVDTQELDKLRNEIKQKELAIEELKKASAAPTAGGAVASKEDTKKFEDKIKELEGRLQEYEIISEDIADLSFYKEENARLQKELGAKGGAPAAPAEPAAAPVVAAPVETPAAVEAAPAVIDADAAAAAAAAEMAPPPVEASAPVDSVIDDDILKEFAAAVEGQKATEKEKKDAKAEAKAEAKAAAEAAAAPAPPEVPAADPAQPVDPQKLTESKELMGEFENFIKKG